MRLLYRHDDGSLDITPYFTNEHTVREYAVLSHTWLSDVDEEVTFQDVRDKRSQDLKVGYDKLRFCCDQAARDGLRYFWVDTCCIDKSSSQELQEAITSMYQWYQNASRCYALLADVTITEEQTNSTNPLRPWEAAFKNSRWFTRGWTLQELLAPKSVEFFTANGVRIGDKESLKRQIQEVTGIPETALRGDCLTDFSIDERLQWARFRRTTRKEDRAYALFGILDVYMPLMYGEGERAFIRLQKKLDKRQVRHHQQNPHPPPPQLPVAFQAAFNSRDNQHATACLAGTRQELLQHIDDWVYGEDERSIFWLNGIAGTGKSTIARTVARTYYDRGNLGGSFFFSARGEHVGVADRLFTTLAWQAWTQIPAVRPYISEAIEQNPGIAEDSHQDQLDQLIFKPLSRLGRASSLSAVVMVIDALNECESERDIRAIPRLLAGSRTSNGVRLRILITSRPDIPDRCGFFQVPKAKRHTFVLQDISPTILDRDLTLFFDHHFKETREARGLPADWPGESKRERLVRLSCGLFLWAATAVRYIHKGGSHATKRINALLDEHGTGTDPGKQLDEIYTTVLKGSIHANYSEEEKKEQYETSRHVVGSIVTLYFPLSRNALAMLLALPPDDIDNTLADLHTVLGVPEDRDQPIRLHHPTFREFIFDKDRCSDRNFWVDDQQAHLIMADHCIDLMSTMLKRDICGLQSPSALAKDVDEQLIEDQIPPELQYACLFWVQHYRRSGTLLQDGDRADRFFQRNFLFWLEAITLIGKRSEAAAIMRMYASLKASRRQSNMSGMQSEQTQRRTPFIHHARQFFSAFQSIIDHAPLQTYCAGLIFMQPWNQLRNHFWGQLHPLLGDVRMIRGNVPEAKEEYNYVNDLAFTPDGRRLASGSTTDYARVWDIDTKETLSKYEGQTGKVSSVAFSPDGRQLASGSDDSTVMIWNLESKEEWPVLGGHTRWVNTIAFSPNGSLLASGSMDETIISWDVASGDEVEKFEPNLGCINSVMFSPDSASLAAGTSDRLITIWDLNTREMLIMLEGHLGAVNSVNYSPDGTQIVSGSDDRTVRLWDAISGAEKKVMRGHSKKVWAATFSRDAQTIASGSEDKTVRLWNASTGDQIATLQGHSSGVNAVLHSPDDRLLTSGSFDDEVHVWDAKTGKSYGKLDDFEEAKRTGVVDASNDLNATEREKGHSDAVTHLISSPDRLLFASGSSDGSVRLWTKEGTEQLKLEGHTTGIHALVFSPSGQLLASCSNGASVRLWDPLEGTQLHRLDGNPGLVSSVEFSADDSLLASCSDRKNIDVWNTTDGVLCAHLEGHSDVVNDIAFSPAQHDLLASCSMDNNIMLWRLPSTEPQAILEGHSSAVNSVAFSPDGTLLVSCSADGTIIIWNVLDEAGSERLRLTHHTSPVNYASLSADNKTVVSCAADGTVRIWDVDTGSVKETLECGLSLRKVAFSERGRFVETDRGRLAYDAASMSLKFDMFVCDDWLKARGEDVLWLSDDFHATCTVTQDETVVLGHGNGGLTFLNL